MILMKEKRGMLRKEFQFFRKKCKLQPVDEALFFSGMWPANFPATRLVQLVMLICSSGHLFSKTKETGSVQDLKTMVAVGANVY